VVAEEIQRLQAAWCGFLEPPNDDGLAVVLSESELAKLDLFDRVQLAEVVRICRTSHSLAEAGRTLFNCSRQQKSTVNDSHRLKQYLQKFALSFQDLR
jgi:transcriptional regulatory protein RtcR